MIKTTIPNNQSNGAFSVWVVLCKNLADGGGGYNLTDGKRANITNIILMPMVVRDSSAEGYKTFRIKLSFYIWIQALLKRYIQKITIQNV